jgi:hypothetical protein
MAVETPQDLAGFFAPADFGEAFAAAWDGGSKSFSGIPSRYHDPQQPGIRTQINTALLKVVARLEDVNEIPDDAVITHSDGSTSTVWLMQVQGDVGILILKPYE